MVINKQHFIQKIHIKFGDLLDAENPDDAWIDLREPTTFEWLQLQEATKEGEKAVLEKAAVLFPEMIVDHNLYETAETKMAATDVVDFIFAKIAISLRVVNEYFTRVSNPLASKSGAK